MGPIAEWADDEQRRCQRAPRPNECTGAGRGSQNSRREDQLRGPHSWWVVASSGGPASEVGGHPCDDRTNTSSATQANIAEIAITPSADGQAIELLKVSQLPWASHGEEA